MSQNYKNHTRYVPMFHFFTGNAILLGLVGSIVNLFRSHPETHYAAALIVLIFIVLVFLFWYTRSFALKAQDRAIRAEENFRHFILTGKPLDNQLRMSQIIALRFASDEELPVLAKRAVEEKLSQKEIKLAITNWKADYNRV
ncbi:MAG: hypothetical protein IPH18_02840 [Chitinophagaceae bacterium]|nr:hypothetical protein [Chitinophagaceae bacterium]MBK8951808.1 hypothetical protein [Chitinophagaceae bacterium]